MASPQYWKDHPLILKQRRCIHDEFGKVDPIKQREPVVPRGSVKRKSGPGPEMPLAKKPANEQVAPVAPMMAGQINTFDSNATSAAAPVVQTKQDGMFRNSTVNDFSSMTGVVNVNPLASRAQGSKHAPTNGYRQSPPRGQQSEWDIDPALMDPALGGPPPRQHPAEDEAYNDAEAALLQYSYYQNNGAPPVSSQDAANQFMNGFVDYEAGQRPGTTKGETDVDIDPALRDAVAGLRNAVGEENQPALNGEADHEQTNGILPSTEASLTEDATPDPAEQLMHESVDEKQRLHTPQLEGSAVKSVSPEGYRKTPTSNGKQRKESSVTIEDADPETRRLIEQLRQENLQTKGLRRRS